MSRQAYGEDLKRPRTFNEAVELRKKSAARLREVTGTRKRVVFTCDACCSASTCPWAFDAYNTNGDCLAEK